MTHPAQGQVAAVNTAPPHHLNPADLQAYFDRTQADMDALGEAVVTVATHLTHLADRIKTLEAAVAQVRAQQP